MKAINKPDKLTQSRQHSNFLNNLADKLTYKKRQKVSLKGVLPLFELEDKVCLATSFGQTLDQLPKKYNTNHFKQSSRYQKNFTSLDNRPDYLPYKPKLKNKASAQLGGQRTSQLAPSTEDSNFQANLQQGLGIKELRSSTQLMNKKAPKQQRKAPFVLKKANISYAHSKGEAPAALRETDSHFWNNMFETPRLNPQQQLQYKPSMEMMPSTTTNFFSTRKPQLALNPPNRKRNELLSMSMTWQSNSKITSEGRVGSHPYRQLPPNGHSQISKNGHQNDGRHFGNRRLQPLDISRTSQKFYGGTECTPEGLPLIRGATTLERTASVFRQGSMLSNSATGQIGEVDGVNERMRAKIRQLELRLQGLSHQSRTLQPSPTRLSHLSKAKDSPTFDDKFSTQSDPFFELEETRGETGEDDLTLSMTRLQSLTVDEATTDSILPTKKSKYQFISNLSLTSVDHREGDTLQQWTSSPKKQKPLRLEAQNKIIMIERQVNKMERTISNEKKTRMQAMYKKQYKVKVSKKLAFFSKSEQLQAILAGKAHKVKVARAATKIQRWFRTQKSAHQASLKLQKMAKAIIIIQRMVKAWHRRRQLNRIIYQKRRDASFVVQKMLRGYLGRQACMKELNEMRMDEMHGHYSKIELQLQTQLQRQVRRAWFKYKQMKREREMNEINSKRRKTLKISPIRKLNPKKAQNFKRTISTTVYNVPNIPVFKEPAAASIEEASESDDSDSVTLRN